MAQRGTWVDAVRSDRAASAVFVAYLVVAGPLLVLVHGAGRWFVLDEWAFFARDVGTVDGFLAPHNGHWVTLPVIAFRAVESVVGLDSYRPYLAMVVASHLIVVALLRAVLRRTGTGPWMATLVASLLVLFAPGRDEIIWAFQISFTGSVGFGFAQFLLADHDGPVGRRDALALGAGLLAVASGGVAIPVLAATGGALLVRRGWRRAVLQVVPLGVLYVIWYVAYDASEAIDVGGPTLDRFVTWLWNAVGVTFEGLGRFQGVAILLAVGLVLGLGLAASGARRPDEEDPAGTGGAQPVAGGSAGRWGAVSAAAARVGAPVAYLGGAVAFALLTARTRWFFGPAAARSVRYVYVYVVLVLPAVGLAAQAIVDRWRRAAPAVVLALLVAVPANARPSAFSDPSFTDQYFASQRRMLTTVVRLPEARRVPRDVQPGRAIPGPFSPDLGVLLAAVDEGRLTPSTGPIPRGEHDVLLVRIGLAHREVANRGAACRIPVGPAPTVHPVGTRFSFTGAVLVRVLGADGKPSPPATYVDGGGGELTVELPDLRLALTPVAGGTIHRCAPPV